MSVEYIENGDHQQISAQIQDHLMVRERRQRHQQEKQREQQPEHNADGARTKAFFCKDEEERDNVCPEAVYHELVRV